MFGASLLASSSIGLVGCKSELDDKPAADPLEDPWVDAIDEDEPAAVAEATPPAGAPELADSVAGEAQLGEAESGGEPGADSVEAAGAEPTDASAPTTVVASPSTPTANNAGSKPGTTGGALADAGTGELAGEPADAAATPIAEPQPTQPAAEPAPAKPAEPAAPPPPTLADLHGDYRFVGGSAQRADLEAAIEDAANQLPAAIRGIGRKRLTKTNPIDDGLEIVVAGSKITTIFSTGFDAGCEVDGPTVHWTSKKGDQYKVRLRSKGAKLVQIIEGEDGVKTTVFVLSADRKKLTVHHKITADRLPEPMTYRLSYSRK